MQRNVVSQEEGLGLDPLTSMQAYDDGFLGRTCRGAAASGMPTAVKPEEKARSGAAAESSMRSQPSAEVSGELNGMPLCG